MPPSQGSVVVEGRYYVFLDDNGRRLSARSAPSTPSTPGMARPPATPALFQPTGSYAVPVVPPGLPAVPQKADKTPLYLAAGIGAATLLIILASSIRR